MAGTQSDGQQLAIVQRRTKVQRKNKASGLEKRSIREIATTSPMTTI